MTVRYPAVVRERFVEAGDVVEAGDALFELRASDGIEEHVSVAGRLLDDLLDRQQALVERMDATAARYDNDATLLDADRANAVRQADHLAAELDAHEARLAIARRQYAQGVRLRRTGAVSDADLLTLADRVQSRLTAVAASRRRLSETRASVATHEARRSRIGHERTAAMAFDRDQLGALAMEEARLRADDSGHLQAPRSGRIGSVRAGAGDHVRPGDVLLDVMPLDRTLEARLHVPPTAVGSIDVGQEVRIHLDAVPYERHGAQHGRVRNVSATALPLGSGDVHAGGLGAFEGFRVGVEFPDGFTLADRPGPGTALRPGMTVSADIVIEYATLADWVMSPLKGAASRL